MKMKRNTAGETGCAKAGTMCAACGKCSRSCPAQIDIPVTIKIYGEYLAGDTRTLEKLNQLKSVGNPVDCIECGACSACCPYGMDAAQMMRELAMMQSCQKIIHFKYSRGKERV